jgi:hypothetical protein
MYQNAASGEDEDSRAARARLKASSESPATAPSIPAIAAAACFQDPSPASGSTVILKPATVSSEAIFTSIW